MKATDLMCGDLILVDKRPTRVYGVMERMGRVYDTMTNDISLKRCEPIPLTPEILEKNGFKKSNQISDNPPYYMDEDGNIYYSLEQNGVNLFWGWWQPDNVYLIPANAMRRLTLYYVHQLQRALRCAGLFELANNFKI